MNNIAEKLDFLKKYKLILKTKTILPEEAPMPDEIEAIKKADKSISAHGTITHDAINWD